ncbi:MAG: SCO family protein [Sulfitobacter sp.]
MTRFYAIAAAVFAVLALITMAILGRNDYFATGPQSCRSTAIAGGEAAIGGPFTLVNGQGETVTDKQVITEPSLVYFGYTYCPDVCPLDVDRNARAVDVLQEQGHSVTPIFISIDPKRDTPEVVSDFAGNMHEKMIGLTGSLEQVDAASKAYKTYYKIHPGDDDDYLVDHSAFTYLVTPQDGFLEVFRRDATPEQMAEKVACFID